MVIAIDRLSCDRDHLRFEHSDLSFQNDVESVALFTFYDDVLALIHLFDDHCVRQEAERVKIFLKQIFEYLQSLEVFDQHSLLFY